MESANLDLEENKEIASKFERALGMGATLAELHGITPDTLECLLIIFLQLTDGGISF